MYNGFAIVLAWPETLCKQPTSWYDPILQWLGINENHYYKVGHAAIILVESTSGNCYYFDFGRYHAPFQFGRVRDQETDPDLKIHTKADISNQTIKNIDDILNEIVSNPSCHGDGNLYASYIPINFNTAYQKAKFLQKDFIPYGPFLLKSSNCSRFVQTIVLSGKPGIINCLKIVFQKTITPTPIGNVKAFSNLKKVSPKIIPSTNHHFGETTLKKTFIPTILPPPEKVQPIPSEAQWLAGEGAGSWFYIKKISNEMIKVTRYSPTGKKEFCGFFQLTSNQIFHENTDYRITYPSHFQKISIIQNQQLLVFEKTEIQPLINDMGQNSHFIPTI